MLNFTENQEAAKVIVKVKKVLWDADPLTQLPLLNFLEVPAESTVSALSPEPEDLVESSDSMGDQMDGSSSIIGMVGSLSLVLTLANAGVPNGPVVSIIKFFQIVFR